MHSSRMRTGRSLTVCCSLLPRGGVCLPGGFSLPGGVSAWSGGVLPARGCLPGPGGVSAWSRGGSPCRGGVCLVPGGSPEPPPPVDRITDTCKSITLATTSLRPVIINEDPTKTDVRNSILQAYVYQRISWLKLILDLVKSIEGWHKVRE